jgi:hypothetical protein
MAFAIELSPSIEKERHMKTEHAKNEKPKLTAISLAKTIWAIGTSTWSGLALSG